jgi:hypothetical protein
VELKPDMTVDEAKEYLRDNLKSSITNDIYPIIQPDREEGGYFGVSRLVLCYVDFLGALYGGYQGERHRPNKRFPRGSKKIATSDKALKFIRTILGSIDSHYQHNADLLYEMHRHGTVHLYAPKFFQRANDGRKLYWFVYKGKREERVPVGRGTLRVRHMEPVPRDEKSDWLPVSIICLYDDLNAAIDEFCARLDSDADLLRRCNQAARALSEPEETSLNW